MESDVITLQDVFLAKPPDEGEAANGTTKLLSPLACTGLKPHFLEKLAANGVVLPPTFFTRPTASARPSARRYGGMCSETGRRPASPLVALALVARRRRRPARRRASGTSTRRRTRRSR